MPTNDELRAAAERLSNPKLPSECGTDVERIGNAAQRALDITALATHYLTQPAPATDEHVAELKRLCDAASALPWSFHAQTHCEVELLLSDNDPDAEPENVLYGRNESANWDFVLSACNAIPALIARLERAERRAFEAECSGGWVGDEKQTVRILELEGEIERLRKDAARYRFIRQKRVGVLDCTWPLWNSTETLDAAIDAAMQETNDA